MKLKQPTWGNKTFWVTLGFIFAIGLVALLAPIIATHDPNLISLRDALQAPSDQNIWGTDLLGRDVFSRVIYGTQTSIAISLLLVVTTMVIGLVVGLCGGFFGGKIDAVLTGVSSVMLAFPDMILALAIAGILGRGTSNAFIALTAIGWVKYARLSRSIVLKTKNRDFFKAAKMTGSKNCYMIWRYLLPETIPSMLIAAAMDIGTVLLSFATLSFLGLGMSIEVPEWGAMLSEGRAQMEVAPWLVLAPGLAIFVVIAIFNIFGDAVRDILDPKST